MKYIYVDTETTKIEGKGERVSFPYILGFTTDEDNLFVPVWWDEIESVFLKRIEKMLLESDLKKITLAAFNAYYDILTIAPFFDKYWKGKINLFLDHRKKFIFGDYRIMLSGVEYTIVFEDYWLFNRNMSINKWHEHFNEEVKPSFDYDKWGPVTIEGDKLIYKNYKGDIAYSDLYDELVYLKSDVLILPRIRQYINKLKDNIVEISDADVSLEKKLKITPGLTAASFSKYIASLKMKSNFDDTFRPTITEGVYKFYTRSFMGGYTVGNKYRHVIDFGEKNYKMVCIDVNSMYPSIISVRLPRGRLLTKKEKPIDHIEWVIICTKDPKLKKKYDFLSDLPIKGELTDGKPWLCTKRLYLLLCELFETEVILKKNLFSETTGKISVMVKELYAKRKEKNTDELTDYSIKILLNSLYGKTCEKTHIKHHILNEEGLKKVIDDYPDYRGILPGIYITCEARSILIDGIIQTIKDGNEFVYADTDSITFVQNKPCSLSIGNDLGQWKVEGKYNFFSRPIVKKKYILEGINSKGEEGIKVAVSGFDKNLVMTMMTKEQRRLLFSPEVNILWRRAKNHSTLNSFNQVIIDLIDVETNESIPITHELIFENKQFTLKDYDCNRKVS